LALLLVDHGYADRRLLERLLRGRDPALHGLERGFRMGAGHPERRLLFPHLFPRLLPLRHGRRGLTARLPARLEFRLTDLALAHRLLVRGPRLPGHRAQARLLALERLQHAYAPRPLPGPCRPVRPRVAAARAASAGGLPGCFRGPGPSPLHALAPAYQRRVRRRSADDPDILGQRPAPRARAHRWERDRAAGSRVLALPPLPEAVD